jgi:hypothetical protein
MRTIIIPLFAPVRSAQGEHPRHSSCIHPALAKLADHREGASMPRSVNRSCLGAGMFAALIALQGCVVYEEPIYHGQPVKIPPGHYPPPGQCRIWYPDRPPGHQPPPGSCRKLRHQVPPDAVLVRG